MWTRRVSGASYHTQEFSCSHSRSHGFCGKRIFLHVSVPCDTSIGVLHINGIPVSTRHGATHIKISVGFINNNAISSGNNFCLIILKLIPPKWPCKNIDTGMIVATIGVVSPCSAVPVFNLIWIIRIMIHIIADAPHVFVRCAVCLFYRPNKLGSCSM